MELSASYVAVLRKKRQGNPSYDLMLRLAEFFDTHPARFVGGRHDRAADSLPSTPFADKLNFLFAHVHPKAVSEFSNNHVVVTVREQGRTLGYKGWTISADTLDNYRKGTKNPGLTHIYALADVFQAQPAYFLDEELACRMQEQLSDHQAMRSLGVSDLIMRAQAAPPPPDVRNKMVAALVRALKPDVNEVRRLLADYPDINNTMRPEAVGDDAAEH
jgi:transcriptional regulator with XRE-family HTH domain